MTSAISTDRAPQSPSMFATSFPPEAELVAAVRRFVTDFYARVLRDSGSSSRVALATHELLENAVSYCAWGDVTIRVSVSPFLTRYMVRVRTRNAASSHNIKALQHLFAELKKADDPSEFFERCMRQSVLNPDASGLGLPRIHAEAAMELKFAHRGDEVEIAAETVLGINRNP